MNILQQINKEKEDFKKPIQIVNNFEFKQGDTIEQIYRYYHSKYASGEIDDQGNKKYFFNIVRTPCNIATKAIDFDTKDIKFQTAPGGDSKTTWYLERDLKFWFKDKNFGSVLNRICHELPIYGSVVLKMIDGKPYFVDLRNFIVQQDVDSLEDADYIIEKHNYTPTKLKRIGNEKGWDNIQETIKRYYELKPKEDKFHNIKYIPVYERYGVDPNDKFKFKRTIIANLKNDDKDDDQYVLANDEIDEIPYREFHWEKIPGRWLGVGRVEVLFDPQIRINEVSNQQVKSSYYSTLRLWQIRDDSVRRNLMTDVENGEVLPVDSEITQIDMSDRNLAQYNQEISRWLMHRDEITFSSDVMAGQRAPAGTPYRSTQLAANMAGSYFAQIQENVAEKLKNLLYDDIIPQFMKENSGKHVLRLVGEDLDKINELIINQKAKQSLFDFVSNNAELPSKDLFDTKKAIIGEQVKADKEKLVNIPKNFYKNSKYKIDIVITGESLDTRQQAANMFAAIQAMTADPTLLVDPNKKKLFTKWLERSGINPTDIEPEGSPQGGPQNMQELLKAKAGGGVSRPSVPNEPQPGQTQSTI